mmetsp:Transcript_45089/g.110665  ORF Transcript_45089/g.110665 Transcript_45089/m.110665 type:complete len:205 (-) Transcript_45089:284-898(-)
MNILRRRPRRWSEVGLIGEAITTTTTIASSSTQLHTAPRRGVHTLTAFYVATTLRALRRQEDKGGIINGQVQINTCTRLGTNKLWKDSTATIGAFIEHNGNIKTTFTSTHRCNVRSTSSSGSSSGGGGGSSSTASTAFLRRFEEITESNNHINVVSQLHRQHSGVRRASDATAAVLVLVHSKSSIEAPLDHRRGGDHVDEVGRR